MPDDGKVCSFDCIYCECGFNAEHRTKKLLPTREEVRTAKVDFMDSAGIGLIMGRYKKIRDIGDICVVGINESIKRILLISGLHKIVDIYDNLCDAVRKQNKRGM